MGFIHLDGRKIQEVKETEKDGGTLLEHVSKVNRILLNNKGVSIRARTSSIEVSEDRVDINSEKVFINTDLQNIILNGVFRFNPELATMVPSTMVTPIPVLKPAFSEGVGDLLKLGHRLKALV